MAPNFRKRKLRIPRNAYFLFVNRWLKTLLCIVRVRILKATAAVVSQAHFLLAQKFERTKNLWNSGTNFFQARLKM